MENWNSTVIYSISKNLPQEDWRDSQGILEAQVCKTQDSWPWLALGLWLETQKLRREWDFRENVDRVFFLFVEMLLGVLKCIDFTMSLSKSLMWHVLIGWCKQKGLHSVLIEFNLYNYNTFCYNIVLYNLYVTINIK